MLLSVTSILVSQNSRDSDSTAAYSNTFPSSEVFSNNQPKPLKAVTYCPTILSSYRPKM